MKSTHKRDTILIVAVIVIFAAAYFVFQKEPEQKSTGFEHPDVAGMTMGGTPEMEKLIAELPKDYDGLIKFGNNYMDQGMYTLAIECYQRGCAIDSTNPDVLIDLGACYHAVGGGEKAIEYFEKALTLNPNHIIGHFNSGIVYRTLGNKEMAVRHWQKVVELDQETPMADSARSYIEH
ncbi:MAG: tetratricopeptide repeat protein, partial [candidate division Zixibacteria bacterium]|nr:tetratricopeptide repeat protein [candidate division Zixibacteria bacterium]